MSKSGEPKWRDVEARAQSVIDAALVRLATHGTSQADTEFERGVIRAMKEILELAEPPSPIPA